MCCQDNSLAQLPICSLELWTMQNHVMSEMQFLFVICEKRDFKIWFVCVCTSIQNVLVNRGDISKEVLNDTSTLLLFVKWCVCRCVRLCVRVVWDSLVAVCGFSKRGGGAQRHWALSIIHPTCHSGNPPEGGQGRVRTSGNLWGVNLNRRETTTEGREEGDEEDDRWQARMGLRKVQREGGQWGKREMARGVTGDCCSGSDRK